MKMRNSCFVLASPFRFLLSFACCLLFFSSTLSATPYLVVSGDLRGEIKPCGCDEEGDMGGLQRRGSALSAWRSEHPELLYLDLGNNFPEPSAQGKLKLAVIQQALQQMQPAAVLPGPHEWNYGQTSWDPALPYLLSNAQDLPWAKMIRRTISGDHWEIWGFVSPELLYQNENDPTTLVAASPGLLKQWQSQSGPDVKRLLLFRGSPTEADFFVRSGWFERILVGSTNDDELNQVTEFVTPSVTLQMIPTKGQGLFHGDLSSPSLDIQWLRRSTPDWEPLSPLFVAYDAEVKQLFLSGLQRMKQREKDSPFVGAASCTTCHVEAHNTWEKSRHSHALATLAKVGKDFDPECLQCHVVGLQQEGYLSQQLTPQLANVQCENCHGPARQHLQNPLSHPPLDARQACVTCHVGSHSPNFDFSTYWPKIQHK